MTGSAAERYLRLGLQLDRHVDGIVDSYFGPPELAAEVKAAPPVEPQELVAEAESLVGELEDGWLRDQAVAVRTFAGVLAGEGISYRDEVERCYGVRPEFADESLFEAAHDELATLLPGAGPLGERYERWRRAGELPPEDVEPAVTAIIDAGRAWTTDRLQLPAGETVELEIVRDKPWLGYCRYLGAYRSLISVNVDLPHSAIELLILAFHETYPGHHAERCLKEQQLVHERGLLEETIVLLPTAQSLIAEGIATLAPELVLDTLGAAVPIDLDVEHARAIERARRPLFAAFVNAALLMYELEAGADEVQAYIERWALATPERAAHAIRFLEDPTSRSYVLTYSAGFELCRAYVGDDRSRFHRLLTEQVRVGELLAGAV